MFIYRVQCEFLFYVYIHFKISFLLVSAFLLVFLIYEKYINLKYIYVYISMLGQCMQHSKLSFGLMLC